MACLLRHITIFTFRTQRQTSFYILFKFIYELIHIYPQSDLLHYSFLLFIYILITLVILYFFSPYSILPGRSHGLELLFPQPFIQPFKKKSSPFYDKLSSQRCLSVIILYKQSTVFPKLTRIREKWRTVLGSFLSVSEMKLQYFGHLMRLIGKDSDAGKD